MKKLIARGLLGVCASLRCVTPAVAALPSTLDVRFQWLVGHPATAPAEKASVFLLPGTVVMAGESAERTADRTLQVIAQLKDAYRLGKLEPEDVAQVIALAPGKATPLPTRVGSL